MMFHPWPTSPKTSPQAKKETHRTLRAKMSFSQSDGSVDTTVSLGSAGSGMKCSGLAAAWWWNPMVGFLRGFIVWAYLGSKHQPNYQRLGKRMLGESDDVDDVVCFILFRNGFSWMTFKNYIHLKGRIKLLHMSRGSAGGATDWKTFPPSQCKPEFLPRKKKQKTSLCKLFLLANIQVYTSSGINKNATP